MHLQTVHIYCTDGALSLKNLYYIWRLGKMTTEIKDDCLVRVHVTVTLAVGPMTLPILRSRVRELY
jgi:hypothetical protein